MTLEQRINILEKENLALRKELDNTNFKLKLLFDNDPVSRFVFEMNYSYEQYTAIMDLMDETRNKLDNNEEITSSDFEYRYQQITNDHDYHSAEIITRLFMEERRWEEVFPALYGKFQKYQTYFKNHNKE